MSLEHKVHHFWGLNIAMGEQTQIDGVHPECSLHNAGLFLQGKACSLRGDTVVVTRIYDSALTLLMFPALAWGGKRLCSLREGGEGVRHGMVREGRREADR